jgi:hypothetical protein
VQVLEQAFALRDIMRLGDRFDPAAGLTAFAAVEQDAGEMRRQMIEQFIFWYTPNVDHASITALNPPGAYMSAAARSRSPRSA